MSYLQRSRISGNKRQVIIITGLSGAGKSLVLKIFEDLGYETIDNLPIFLFSDAVQMDLEISKPLVVDVDSRTRGFSLQALEKEISRFRAQDNINLILIYLDCDHEVILKRYRETRRHHPLSHEGSIAKGVQKERKVLEGLKKWADLIIDTSLYTPPQLRSNLMQLFDRSVSKTFSVALSSFSYPHGLPRDADMIFDMRFLPNPFYQDELKNFTGENVLIKDYLTQQKSFQDFRSHFQGLICFVLPYFEKEGRDYFSIAFGCTGGHHRSVFMADWAASFLQSKGYAVTLAHRELS